MRPHSKWLINIFMNEANDTQYETPDGLHLKISLLSFQIAVTSAS